jgi:SET domain-containing protein
MIGDTIIKDAGRKGKGVFALKPIRRGEFIFRSRRGPFIHTKDLRRLSGDEMKHLNEVDKDTFEMMLPPARFVNHSCEPNAITKGASLFALKRIRKGEEITTDYRLNGLFSNRWRCYCGSRNCSGWVVSNFFTLPEELQRKYLPYTLNVIREEFRRRRADSIK